MKFTSNSKLKKPTKLKVTWRTRCLLSKWREAGMSGLALGLASMRTGTSRSSRGPRRLGKRGYKTSKTKGSTTRWREWFLTQRRETKSSPSNTLSRNCLTLIIVLNNTKKLWTWPWVRNGRLFRVTRDSFSQTCWPRLERSSNLSGLRRTLLPRQSTHLCSTGKTKEKRGLQLSSEIN